MRPVVALLCAIVLATGTWLTLTPTLAGTPSASCEVTDRLAEHHGYDEWDRTVLGPDRRLPDDYEPPDLVSAASANLDARFLVRRLIVDDLRRMQQAASTNGVRLEIGSAYRSAHAQASLRQAMIRKLGHRAAERLVARPGHSEHQLGTALDFSDTSGAHPWLATNASRFGFVQSYGGASHQCTDREDWHYRYLGFDAAQAVVASGLAANDYLSHRYGGE